MKTGKLVLGICTFAIPLFVQAQDVGRAIRDQAERSRILMLQNISRPDTRPGVVVAAPSKQNPNYYFHWIRDAALTIKTVVDLYNLSPDPSEKKVYGKILRDFVDFSRFNQLTPNRSGGPGEPKFNVDGSAYNGDWGRPQNDGPALRASALIGLARILLNQGEAGYVREKLYDGKNPTQSVIKFDLEYLANHWQDPCFDIWEEVSGRQFYTLLVQRKALMEGASLASDLGDGIAGYTYMQQAKNIEQALTQFWNPQKQILVPTVAQNGGITYKNSGLDSSVILGVLHGDPGDGFLSPGNDMVLSTAYQLETAFRQIYRINQNTTLGAAIGRYPEDRYDGLGLASAVTAGNPWFLTTLAFAELSYKARLQFIRQRSVKITPLNMKFLGQFDSRIQNLAPGTVLAAGTPAFQAITKGLLRKGDEYFRRVLLHRGPDGSLSEQFNRDSGYMQGAPNLTWSHAAVLSALFSRH